MRQPGTTPRVSITTNIQALKGRHLPTAMLQSLAQILVHIVFSTKHRERLIEDAELFDASAAMSENVDIDIVADFQPLSVEGGPADVYPLTGDLVDDLRQV